MNEQLVAQRVHDYIVENFLYTRTDFELGAEDSLLGGGIMDSMGVMELVAFLEEEYRVVVADVDITVENLGTIGRIARYVVEAAGKFGAAA